MDTNKYAALLSIIRLGSLSAAAEKMGYSPSGMTRMMDSLENEMGFPLLHRTSQGVQLTEEGKRLLPSIRELLLAEKKTRAVRCDILSLTAGELFIVFQHCCCLAAAGASPLLRSLSRCSRAP